MNVKYGLFLFCLFILKCICLLQSFNSHPVTTPNMSAPPMATPFGVSVEKYFNFWYMSDCVCDVLFTWQFFVYFPRVKWSDINVMVWSAVKQETLTCAVNVLAAICGEAAYWQYASRATKDAACRNATYWHASNRNASSSGTTCRCDVHLMSIVWLITSILLLTCCSVRNA